MPETRELSEGRRLMGRHSAPPLIEEPRPFRDVPSPVTDPRLFDGPLPVVRPAVRQAPLPQPVQPSGARAVIDPRSHRQPAAPASVADEIGFIDDAEIVGQAYRPRSVRGSGVRSDDHLVPQVAGASLLGVSRQGTRPVRPAEQRYARTGPDPVVMDEDLEEQPQKRPSAFARRRELALAAAAVAVVGAVSGVAAILPANTDAALAAAKTGPLTTPMPTASGGSGLTCISPVQLRQAMRRHHHLHHGHPIAARPAESTAGSVAAASSTPRASTSSTPRSSASPRSSSTPSNTSWSSTPAVATTGLDLLGIVRSAVSNVMEGLNAGTYVLDDFSSQSHGVTLGKVGLQGAGIDKTVIEMAPHSSTKAGLVPTADLTTNPLYLMSTIGGTPGLHGFTLKGTDQGHLYGGLFVGQTTNARVSDVKITDIPGNKNYPPGETFSLNDWRTDGSVYNNIHIDGGGTAAVDFGSNSTTNITVNNSVFTGTKYSSAMAMWQTKNITLNDVTLKDNRSGINFERAAGNITINRPVLSNNGLYDFQFGTDQEGGNVVINDPVLAAGQKIVINAPMQYHGVTNGQKRANIHVYVNGVDKTASLVQYR